MYKTEDREDGRPTRENGGLGTATMEGARLGFSTKKIAVAVARFSFLFFEKVLLMNLLCALFHDKNDERKSNHLKT